MTEIDIFGVPEFFSSHVAIEDAGDGMVRLINCIRRNGSSQPVCSIVMSAQSLLQLCRNAEGMVTKIMMTGCASENDVTAGAVPRGMN